MEKEANIMQDFFASGPIIRKSATDLCQILHSDILSKEYTEKYLNICKPLKTWKLVENPTNDIANIKDIKESLKSLYDMHKRDPLEVDIGIMYRLANKIYSRLRWPGEPMKKLTKAEENYHNLSKECWICENSYGEDTLKKVQDYNHITGKYRGPTHSSCNL